MSRPKHDNESRVETQIVALGLGLALALASHVLGPVGHARAAGGGTEAALTMAPIGIRPLGASSGGRFEFGRVVFVGTGLEPGNYEGPWGRTLAVAVMAPAANAMQEKVEVEQRALHAAAAGCPALAIVQRGVAVDDWILFRPDAPVNIAVAGTRLFAADARLLRALTGSDDFQGLLANPVPSWFAVAGSVGEPAPVPVQLPAPIASPTPIATPAPIATVIATPTPIPIPAATPAPAPTPELGTKASLSRRTIVEATPTPVVVVKPAATSRRAPRPPVQHPRLIDVETTECSGCHAAVLEGTNMVHEPAADDCTTCHDMEIGEERTVVSLTEAEPELCLTCHDLEDAVAGDLDAPHYPVTQSCLECHQPHASDQPHLLAAAVPSLCTDCHDADGLGQSHSGQITRVTDCTSCHRPHGGAVARLLIGSKLHPPFADGDCATCHRQPFGDKVRLRARGERICVTCHSSIIGEDRNDGLHHAAVLSRGARGGCVSCHNPHMSDNKTLLREKGAQLCKKCHEPIVTAALSDTGHAAAEDCNDCHAPHRADEPKLLIEPLSELCSTCHDLDEDLSLTHLGADLEELSCVSCHTPHGAGHPHLLATHVHPPVLDGCDDCHDGSVSEFTEEDPELCLMCHDDIGDQIEAAVVPHDAIEFDGCVACHNPHASPQDHLVKGPGAGPCAECHDEGVLEDGEFAHGVIDLIGCHACHEPHGSDNETLLRKAGNELCLSCHDPRQAKADPATGIVTLLDHFDIPSSKVRGMASLRLSKDGERGHPVTGHRVVGTPTEQELGRVETSFTGELTCLSCHDPHKSRSPQLLKGNSASAMGSCAACHPK